MILFSSSRVRPVCFLICLLVSRSPLEPATITVAGGCTLVDAVVAANTDAAAGDCPAGSGADTIVLTGDVTLTEAFQTNSQGATGLPSVTSEIVLDGEHFVVRRQDSGPRFRIGHVDTTGNLTLKNTTISNGFAEFLSFPDFDAELGGGLLNEGVLTLTNSTVTGNEAGSASPFYEYGIGGGIATSGILRIYSSTISDNVAHSYLGGGAGLFVDGNTLIVNSTISGNFDVEDYALGGGIWRASGTLRLINTTLSNNFAAYGGAIFGNASLVHSTVADNTTIPDYGYSGALHGAITVTGSVLGYNQTGGSCDDTGIVDGGGNFSDDMSCPAGFAMLTGLDPILALNGGATRTHALLPGSSAADTTGDCGIGVDQRAFARDGNCDAGAFELGAQLLALSLVGSCPGTLDVSVTGATPSAEVTIYQGAGIDGGVVPSGSCSGTQLEVAAPDLVATATADGVGGASIMLAVDAGDCAEYLEAVNFAGIASDTCATSLAEQIGCSPLTLSHTGSGSDPVASPNASPGCDLGRYAAGESITLTATAETGWEVSGWIGTDDDSSTSAINSVTMPSGALAVSVDYIHSCFSLTLGHTGSGADPAATGLGTGNVWTGGSVSPDFAAMGATTGDYDGDGDADVAGLSASSGDVAWFENVAGDGSSWTEHVLAVDYIGAQWIGTADIDGDDDLDLFGLGAFQREIVWWENTAGDGSAWTERLIEASFEGAEFAHAADLDGDGDLDVVVAADTTSGIAWWENVDGDGLQWTKHVIFAVNHNHRSVFAADIDGDLDMDVLSAASFSNDITWWENVDGDGLTWAENIIDGDFRVPWTVVAADIDGDGDPDVLSSAGADVDTVWWENLFGDGSAWQEHVVDGEFFCRRVTVTDVDGDGDPDIAGGNFFEIVWWENTSGAGTAWTRRSIEATTGAQQFAFVAADLDVDGDTDLVGTTGTDGALPWWRNDYAGSCDPGLFHYRDRVQLEADPDEGWFVGSWTGTGDDGSRSVVNQVTMPETDHAASVAYVPVPFELTISGEVLTDTETFEACETIVVGEDVEIAPGAVVVLRAPRILFLSDVSVLSGATLTADNSLPLGCSVASID